MSQLTYRRACIGYIKYVIIDVGKHLFKSLSYLGNFKAVYNYILSTYNVIDRRWISMNYCDKKYIISQIFNSILIILNTCNIRVSICRYRFSTFFINSNCLICTCFYFYITLLKTYILKKKMFKFS